MSGHDPLCPMAGTEPLNSKWVERRCRCELIASVREKEREISLSQREMIKALTVELMDASKERESLVNRITAALILLGKSGDMTPQAKRTIYQILEEEK